MAITGQGRKTVWNRPTTQGARLPPVPLGRLVDNDHPPTTGRCPIHRSVVAMNFMSIALRRSAPVAPSLVMVRCDGYGQLGAARPLWPILGWPATSRRVYGQAPTRRGRTVGKQSHSPSAFFRHAVSTRRVGRSSSRRLSAHGIRGSSGRVPRLICVLPKIRRNMTTMQRPCDKRVTGTTQLGRLSTGNRMRGGLALVAIRGVCLHS